MRLCCFHRFPAELEGVHASVAALCGGLQVAHSCDGMSRLLRVSAGRNAGLSHVTWSVNGRIPPGVRTMLKMCYRIEEEQECEARRHPNHMQQI